MMEPASIATLCVAAIATVAKLTVQVNRFVSNVRDARKDMEAVSRELASLTMALSALRDDSDKVRFPPSLLGVVRNCDQVAAEMRDMLRRLDADSIVGQIRGQIRWTIGDREQMEKMRSSLESHKSAIDVALDMASFQLLLGVKDDTSVIRGHTAAIRADTSQIREDTGQISNLFREIRHLRRQVAHLKHGQKGNDKGSSILLQRFLDDSTSYAESVADDISVISDRTLVPRSKSEMSLVSRTKSQPELFPKDITGDQERGKMLKRPIAKRWFSSGKKAV